MWCTWSFFIVNKNLLAKFLPPHKIFVPSPPKVNSTQQKNRNIIFNCSHSSCTIFVLISYSFETQIMLILILIDVQYSQNAVYLCIHKIFSIVKIIWFMWFRLIRLVFVSKIFRNKFYLLNHLIIAFRLGIFILLGRANR